jgi:hypothetical protein
MQQQEIEATAEQLRDRIWTYAQRGVVALVIFLAGLFLGYQFWGQATQLQEKVDELTERNQALVKERDTERSKVTLIERDKKELDRQLQDARTRVAAAEQKAASALERPAGGAAPAPAEAKPGA